MRKIIIIILIIAGIIIVALPSMPVTIGNITYKDWAESLLVLIITFIFIKIGNRRKHSKNNR